MTQSTTYTLEVPGAELTYDIRRQPRSQEPVLFVLGSPMTASFFGPLGDQFPDRTVVTYDPRGTERSPRTDGSVESTPDEHADDLHRIITELGEGPVDVFASSGGAVNALALVAQHPDDVRILVAHEPPAATVLPDADLVLAANRDVHDTYLRDGYGPAMAKFIALVSLAGPLPADYLERPAPDPTMFGLQTVDDGSRGDPLLGQNMLSCGAYKHDFDAMRQAPTRIVIGIGADSSQATAGRAGIGVAERLGSTPVVFPGGHGGFLPTDMGQGPGPEAFAGVLRQALADARVAEPSLQR
jgi:pimeloyl-ACP methyl ester carboxylesterase